MEIIQMPKELVARIKERGIDVVELHFSGGSDEGMLNVEAIPDILTYSDALLEEIEEWANEAYEYGGAGDGSDYGDDIVYDFKNGKITASDWYMARTEGETFEEGIK